MMVKRDTSQVTMCGSWGEKSIRFRSNIRLPIVEELRLTKCFLDGEKMRLMLRLNFGKFEMR